MSPSSLGGSTWDDVDWSRIDNIFDVSEKSLSALALAAGHDPALFFRERSFAGLALSGVDVRGIDFTNCDLRGTKISEARIDRSTNLSGARLDKRDRDALRRNGVLLREEFDFEVSSSESSDLVDLTIWPPHQGDRGGDLPIRCDLRFGMLIIENEDYRILIHVRRAEIVLSGENFHLALLPDLDDSQTEYRTETSGSLKIAAKSSGGRPSESGKATMLAAKRVLALPNNRWEVSEAGGNLVGSYLSAGVDDGLLCRIRPDGDAFLVNFSVVVAPDDLTFTIEPLGRRHAEGLVWNYAAKVYRGLFPPARPDRDAIMKLLVRKALKGALNVDVEDSGRIPLARATLRGTRWSASER